MRGSNSTNRSASQQIEWLWIVKFQRVVSDSVRSAEPLASQRENQRADSHH